MFHAGLLLGARIHRVLQLIEPQLFADIELDENQHGAAHRRCDLGCGKCRHRTQASYLIAVKGGCGRFIFTRDKCNRIRR